jgi:hypothetical protein
MASTKRRPDCDRCGRAVTGWARRAPTSRLLPDAEFCRLCARPLDEKAAVFASEAWRAYLIRLRALEDEVPLAHR